MHLSYVLELTYNYESGNAISFLKSRIKTVGVEHLIALLTPQRFQIPLTPRMFPVWDFVVGIFARKALLNSGQVLSTLSC